VREKQTLTCRRKQINRQQISHRNHAEKKVTKISTNQEFCILHTHTYTHTHTSFKNKVKIRAYLVDGTLKEFVTKMPAKNG
jgi:hypothetical protein